MKLFADHDPRFRLLFLKVALFLIAAVLGVLLIVGGLGLAGGLFTKKTPFYFIAGNALDIRPGMAVMLSGFKIGTVKDLTLQDDAAVHVDILIEDRYIKWMRQGTSVEVKKQGLIGEAYLDVRPGRSPELLAQDGKGMIAYKSSKGLEEIAGEIEAKVMPVVQDAHAVVRDLRELTEDLNDERGDFRRTLGNAERLTGQGARTLAAVDRLAASLDGTVRTRVDPALAQAESTLAAAEDAAASARGQIDRLDVGALQSGADAALRRLNTSLDDVNAMTRALKEPVGQAAPRLPGFVDDTHALVLQGQGTLRRADATFSDVERMVEGAGRQWPFSLWVPPPPDLLIPEEGR